MHRALFLLVLCLVSSHAAIVSGQHSWHVERDRSGRLRKVRTPSVHGQRSRAKYEPIRARASSGFSWPVIYGQVQVTAANPAISTLADTVYEMKAGDKSCSVVAVTGFAPFFSGTSIGIATGGADRYAYIKDYASDQYIHVANISGRSIAPAISFQASSLATVTIDAPSRRLFATGAIQDEILPNGSFVTHSYVWRFSLDLQEELYELQIKDTSALGPFSIIAYNPQSQVAIGISVDPANNYADNTALLAYAFNMSNEAQGAAVGSGSGLHCDTGLPQLLFYVESSEEEIRAGADRLQLWGVATNASDNYNTMVLQQFDVDTTRPKNENSCKSISIPGNGNNWAGSTYHAETDTVIVAYSTDQAACVSQLVAYDRKTGQVVAEHEFECCLEGISVEN